MGKDLINLIDNNFSFNCIVTEFYEPLFKEFIEPSFANSKIKINQIRNQNIYGQGFNKPEFIESIIFKVEKIIQSLKENKLAIWTDVDIIFTETPEKIVYDLQKRIKNYDILISPENNYGNINTGFFIAKSNHKTIDLFQETLKEIKTHKITEQPVIERLLDPKKIKFNVLPTTYWNLTVDFPIPKDVKIIHANWIAHRRLGNLNGKNYVEKKISALRKLKLMNQNKLY